MYFWVWLTNGFANENTNSRTEYFYIILLNGF